MGRLIRCIQRGAVAHGCYRYEHSAGNAFAFFMITLNKQDAARLLVSHHFQQTSLRGAFERLGSVQYDPLNQVGCNHDLVLQARVPGYTVGAWQEVAYRGRRFVFDAWDKQASLVLMRDYPVRRIYYDWHAPRWREAVLDRYPEAVRIVIDELRERGPLASSDFHYQEHREQWEGSWHGPRLTKHILRGLWHTGKVHTCKRNKGRHLYDLAERVVPDHLYRAEPLSANQSIDWLILLRHQALGLMRPNAGPAVWSLGITPAERRWHLQDLVRRGALVPVDVDGVRYHVLPRTMELLDQPVEAEQTMRFVAPLDQLMWDRPAVAHLFDFDYVWEVYKPKQRRRWGYYVLPVMLNDRFVARIDSGLSQGIWQLHTWHWEDGHQVTPSLLSALERAVGRFRSYLGAELLKLPRGMDRRLHSAFRSGFKSDS